MKILVMSFGSDAGGIEKSLMTFLRYLCNTGASVDLYLWREPGIFYEQIPKEVNVLSFDARPGALGQCIKSKRPIGRVLWYIKARLYRLFGCEVKAFAPFPGEYDIAISYCQNGYSPRYVIDKVKANKKYLWYHHGSYEGHRGQIRSDTRYYAAYDRIFVVSHACKQMLLEFFPYIGYKMTVVHNLLDAQEIRALAQKALDLTCIGENGGCKIVTVGRLSPEKGQILAIETAKLLKHQGFSFTWIFVGDGPLRAQCEHLVQQYRLDACCVFVGAQSNPYPFVRWADVCVQPSEIEADPLTVAEALVLERLVIASDIPPMREALQNGQCGILVPRTASDFCDAVMQYSKVQGICHVYDLQTRTLQAQQKLDWILWQSADPQQALKHTKRIQTVELELLRAFIEVCERMQLRYFALGGTALGAVRHQGFIPWDDDVDVGLLRSDYEEFIAHAQRYLPERIRLRTWKTDPLLGIGYCKLTCEDELGMSLFIDVFPLDYYPESKSRAFYQKKVYLDWRIALDAGYRPPTAKQRLIALLLKIRWPLRKQALMQRDTHVRSVQKSNLIANLCGVYGLREICKAWWFGEGIELPFEGISLRCPAYTDEYLTHLYGDYMKLPPEHERIPKHDLEA